jgi:hypothetical protein
MTRMMVMVGKCLFLCLSVGPCHNLLNQSSHSSALPPHACRICESVWKPALPYNHTPFNTSTTRWFIHHLLVRTALLLVMLLTLHPRYGMRTPKPAMGERVRQGGRSCGAFTKQFLEATGVLVRNIMLIVVVWRSGLG